MRNSDEKILQKRLLEIFIMQEFVNNRITTYNDVMQLVHLVQNKLGFNKKEAGKFIRNAIGFFRNKKQV